MTFSQVSMWWLRFKYFKSVYWSSCVRTYFECRILPYFHHQKRFQNIVLVGIGKFTQHYPEYFNHKRSVYSIDMDIEKTHYAHTKSHIVDSVDNIEQYFEKCVVDLVFMNGVYGWGLNEERKLVVSLEKIRSVMKTGGVLVFGWNEVPKYDPLQIRTKNYFSAFEPYYFEGKKEIILANNPKKHIFRFYKKV